MRNIVVFLISVIAITTSCNNSRDSNFYKLALRDAEKQHKFLLLDFSAEWCGGCKGFDKYVFNDSSIIEKLAGNFHFLRIDRDNPENSFLVKKFRIQGLPHIVLINAHEEILGSVEGFDSRYVENPDLFLSGLNNIIELQDSIRILETTFYSDTTNIEGANNLLNGYRLVNRHIEIPKLENLLVRLDPSPDRIFEHNYNQAIIALRNKADTGLIMKFIRENPEIDYNHKWGIYSHLLYYYRDKEDIKNEDKYYLILIKIDPVYFEHHYAEFLFENKIKLDTARLLSKKINSIKDLRDDFWGQYLVAHSLASMGKVNEAVSQYGTWMDSKKQIWLSGDDYWILYFYARFADFYNVDLERALSYIQIAEKNRNMIDEKILEADILFKLGQLEKCILKLNESLNLTENPEEYRKITNKIEEYKAKGVPDA